MTLLDSLQQKQISQQVRLPVNDTTSSKVVSIAGESLTFEYWNAGVLTNDAGQAAGTKIQFKLVYGNVRNAAGDTMGTHNDSSFSFGTGTVLTNEKPFPYLIAEQYAGDTGVNKINAILSGFVQGEYCVDYEKGIGYGVKADAGFVETGSYKIEQGLTGGGAGAASSVETTPATKSEAASNALEASNALVAAAATLYELRFTNTGAAQYIQIFDAAAVPIDTTVPDHLVYVPGTTSGSITFPQGIAMSNGISVSNSSTAATKTIGAADCWFEVTYE